MVFTEIPEKIRMIIIAIVGSFIGWITYELIYLINPLSTCRASSSWITEFIIGTARQHALHRWFTFTHFTPYWSSLLRAYFYYSATAGIGAGLNFFLTEFLHLHHRLAWAACLIVTASISLFSLKRLVYKQATLS